MFQRKFGHPALTVRLLSTREEKSVLLTPGLTQRIRFLDHDLMAHRSFLVAFDKDEVVGVISLVMDSHRIPGALGVGFVSTHDDHRNRGVSKVLVKALFELAVHRNQAIANTSYEPEGELWLKHVMRRTAALYPEVDFYERDQSPTMQPA